MGAVRTLGIVGGGNVGQALGRLLAPHFGVLIASRNRGGEAVAFAGGGARVCALEELGGACDCIVIAVPDSAVAAVATALAKNSPPAVLQTCGALGPTDLSPLPEHGVSCATFHPLQTFPHPEAGVRSLPGSAFGVCGSGEAATWCGRLARTLGGTTLVIDEDCLPLYHAAAVVASNCTIGLVDAASRLMERAGVQGSDGSRALRPLIEASLRNALTMGTEQALTGPVARGDAATVRRHLDAMRNDPGPLRDLYRALGHYLLAMAVRSGLTPEEAVALRLSLTEEP